MMTNKLLCASLLLAFAGESFAAPATYKIDPSHTYPSFEADHLGISVWRGKMTKSSGTVLLDKQAGSGSVDVTIDPASIDFGQKQLDHWAVGDQFLDTEKFGTITYKGKLGGFTAGAPTTVDGELTLRGVTRPVKLQIKTFKCIAHPLFKRDYCGADAYGVFKRDEFGLSAGKDYGFNMDVNLRIQVEAIVNE